jgi:hypothetical protein
MLAGALEDRLFSRFISREYINRAGPKVIVLISDMSEIVVILLSNFFGIMPSRLKVNFSEIADSTKPTSLRSPCLESFMMAAITLSALAAMEAGMDVAAKSPKIAAEIVLFLTLLVSGLCVWALFDSFLLFFMIFLDCTIARFEVDAMKPKMPPLQRGLLQIVEHCRDQLVLGCGNSGDTILN